MTIVRWGIPTIVISSLVLAAMVLVLPEGALRWTGLGLAVALDVFVLAFFRNPRRIPQGGEQGLIAPADGVIADITECAEAPWLGGPALRIGIFLSVFDVHVNRAPAAGRIAWSDYKPGRFLDARHPDANHANEANSLGMELDRGGRILLRQISGLIARRIVCAVGIGDRLQKGELYGMIRFGSRTELWVPKDMEPQLRVAVGDRVRCGETLLVDLEA